MRGIKRRNITFSSSNLRKKDFFTNLLHVCGHLYIRTQAIPVIYRRGGGGVELSVSAGRLVRDNLKVLPLPWASPMLLGVFAFLVITTLATVHVRLISVELS